MLLFLGRNPDILWSWRVVHREELHAGLQLGVAYDQCSSPAHVAERLGLGLD